MTFSHGVLLLAACATIALGQDNEAVANNDYRPVVKTEVEEINLNTVFDASLPHIRRFISKNGWDPMEAPDIEIPLSHLPGLLKTKMQLHHGIIQQLSTIYRTGDITMQYSNEKISLYMNIGWESLDVSHQYVYRYMLYSRKGDCYGRFHDVMASMLIHYDLNTKKIDLKFFKFVDVGDFKLRLEGHWSDKLLNLISKAVTKVFRTQVLRTIEAITYKELNKKVQEINDLIENPVNTEAPSTEEDIEGYGWNGLYAV